MAVEPPKEKIACINKPVKTLEEHKRPQKFAKVDVDLPAETTREIKTRAQPSPGIATIKDDVVTSWDPGELYTVLRAEL